MRKPTAATPAAPRYENSCENGKSFFFRSCEACIVAPQLGRYGENHVYLEFIKRSFVKAIKNAVYERSPHHVFRQD